MWPLIKAVVIYCFFSAESYQRSHCLFFNPLSFPINSQLKGWDKHEWRFITSLFSLPSPTSWIKELHSVPWCDWRMGDSKLNTMFQAMFLGEREKERERERERERVFFEPQLWTQINKLINNKEPLRASLLGHDMTFLGFSPCIHQPPKTR